MKTLTFSEFYEGNYDDHGYELYLLRDSEDNVMYIGIARDSIWHRWFGGGMSHMEANVAGTLYGKSYIGEVLERRLPSSWNWIIELWTKEECLSACQNAFAGRDLDRIQIESIEPYMINKFKPLYNVAHSGSRHEDPLTTEKLDQIYRDLFG